MPRPRTPLQERFNKHVIKGEECWGWSGRTNQGYAMLRAHADELPGMRSTDRAARIAWFLAYGAVPEGMTVDHTCHNGSGCNAGSDCPHRRCTNPAHLEVVSARENTLRGNNPTAMNARKTHCKRGHPLDGDNLRIYASGSRACRECQRQREAERKQAPSRKRRAKPPATTAGKVGGDRHNTAKTHCPRGHEYTEANTYRYKGKRFCRTCRNAAIRRLRSAST